MDSLSSCITSSEVPYLHAMSAEMMGKDQGNAFKFEVKKKEKDTGERQNLSLDSESGKMWWGVG